MSALFFISLDCFALGQRRVTYLFTRRISIFTGPQVAQMAVPDCSFTRDKA